MSFFRLFPVLMLFVLFGSPVSAREVVQVGWWSQYAEGVTNAQVAHHGFSFDEDEGFIAALDCSVVGEHAWIKVNDSNWFRVRVFDCLGGNGDPSWWRRNRLLGELDYYTAEKHGVAGLGGVRAHLAFERDLGNLSDSEISAWAIPVNTGSPDLEVIDNNVIEPKSFSGSILYDLNTIGNIPAPSVFEGEGERHTDPLPFIYPTYSNCGGFDLPADSIFVFAPFSRKAPSTPPIPCLFVPVGPVVVDHVDRRWDFYLDFNMKQALSHRATDYTR